MSTRNVSGERINIDMRGSPSSGLHSTVSNKVHSTAIPDPQKKKRDEAEHGEARAETDSSTAKKLHLDKMRENTSPEKDTFGSRLVYDTIGQEVDVMEIDSKSKDGELDSKL